jgi:hypothetical protein
MSYGYPLHSLHYYLCVNVGEWVGGWFSDPDIHDEGTRPIPMDESLCLGGNRRSWIRTSNGSSNMIINVLVDGSVTLSSSGH